MAIDEEGVYDVQGSLARGFKMMVVLGRVRTEDLDCYVVRAFKKLPGTEDDDAVFFL